MRKTLQHKIKAESAQEKLVKYFVFKEMDLLGKRKYEVGSINDSGLNPNYILELYKKNPINN